MLVHAPAARKHPQRGVKRGSGLLNTLINKLPLELHIPGYRYCGPGTKLDKRLARGDPPKNPLDTACQKHDIAYSNFTDLEHRHEADKELEKRAVERFKASDSSLGEKMAALGVTAAMKAKRKLGMGLKSKSKKGKGMRMKRHKRQKRIIPIPKRGGFLPLLLPILGALGALGGGAAGIAKAVNDAKANKERLAEQKRHDLAVETAVKGKGIYLRPYKKGMGLYLAPYKKNFQ